MNCNSMSAFCQQFVSSPHIRWSRATSCQQYVNNNFGTTTPQAANRLVVEHKGIAIRARRFLAVLCLFLVG